MSLGALMLGGGVGAGAAATQAAGPNMDQLLLALQLMQAGQPTPQAGGLGPLAQPGLAPQPANPMDILQKINPAMR